MGMTEELSENFTSALEIVQDMDEPGFHVSTEKQLLTVVRIAEALRAEYTRGLEEGRQERFPQRYYPPQPETFS